MRGGPKWARADSSMFHPLVAEAFCQGLEVLGASRVAQMLKESPQNAEVWVRSLGWEHPLEEGTATHSCLFAWRNPSTEEVGRLQFMGTQRVNMTERLTTHTVFQVLSSTTDSSLVSVTICNSFKIKVGNSVG